MSRIWRRTLVVGLAFALLISSVGLPSLAQSTSARPGDFFLQEWGFATVASSFVAISGLGATYLAMRSTFYDVVRRGLAEMSEEEQTKLEEDLSQLEKACPELGRGACEEALKRLVRNPKLSKIIVATVSATERVKEIGSLAIAMAVPVTSILAVVAIASLNEVSGNVPLAILGSLGGMLAAAVINYFFEPQPSIALLLVSSLTALGTTVGYNIGAKMRSESEKDSVGIGLTLPLFAMQF